MKIVIGFILLSQLTFGSVSQESKISFTSGETETIYVRKHSVSNGLGYSLKLENVDGQFKVLRISSKEYSAYQKELKSFVTLLNVKNKGRGLASCDSTIEIDSKSACFSSLPEQTRKKILSFWAKATHNF